MKTKPAKKTSEAQYFSSLLFGALRPRVCSPPWAPRNPPESSLEGYAQRFLNGFEDKKHVKKAWFGTSATHHMSRSPGIPGFTCPALPTGM